jgi:chromosome segregation ATPase
MPQSANLNTSDPVAMHLLMETAMVDSKQFEVLSFEEVEELKRERALLRSRIEATRRKLALERKLKDAAQSLNRLYSTKGRRESDETANDGSPKSPRKTRRSILGNRSNSNEVLNRTDDEYAASNRKCDELAQDLSAMEKRSEEVAKRILEHTAGILQLTHKGLKKNIRRDNLPRSPESMASLNHGSMMNFDGLDDFDDRSFYRSLDHFDDHGGADRKAELQMLEQTEKQLDAVNNRIRGMVLQADPNQQLDPPPQKRKSEAAQQSGSQIQAHLKYLGQALESIEAAQARTVQDAQRSVYDSEDQMEDINVRLHDMLQKTNTVGQSPVGFAPDSRGKSLQSQLSFSDMVLDRLNQRVEHLVEQKDILSRQIQQQRDLNSRSDVQRDGQIMQLTNDLADAQEQQEQHEKEIQSATDQIHLLMEQLDSSRQESVLLDQKRQSEDRKALQAEKNAKKKAEDSLKKLQGTLKVEKEAKKRAEDNLKKSQGTLQAEKDSKKRAEESLGKLQGTLQAGNDAQQQIHENIAQLQGTVQTERDARRQAEEDLAQLQVSLRKENDAQRHADDTLTQLQGTLQAERDNARDLEEQLTQVQGDLDEAKIDKAQAEAEVEKCRSEVKDLEGAVVRAQTDLTVVRAELDGAYGTRAQRAADVTMNPAVQKEIDELNDKNKSLQSEINSLKMQGSGNAELQSKIDGLQKELKDTIEDYEQMTKASVEFEKDREQLESSADAMRERCEALEAKLSDEKVKWLGMKSPGVNGPGSPGSTSTMILKNEFKKMMRDTRADNLKALRACFPLLLS